MDRLVDCFTSPRENETVIFVRRSSGVWGGWRIMRVNHGWKYAFIFTYLFFFFFLEIDRIHLAKLKLR